MKKISPWLVAVLLIAALCAAGYYYYESRPCVTPIPYSVGTFDPRFNISRADFVIYTKEAAALWNTAAGHTVLVYSATGTLPVSLVYDTRQQLAQTSSSIDQLQAANESEKAKIDALKTSYDTAEQAYLAAQRAFEQESNAYNARVKQVNVSGGADAATAAQLDAERTSLEQKQKTLNAQGDALNAQANALRARTDTLNAAIANSNAKAQSYNTQAGKDFNEGVYSTDASGAKITIYEFQNHTQLVRVLAHEFGHALGLAHDTGTESIMYPYNTGTTIALSDQDIAELQAACSFSPVATLKQFFSK